MDTDLSSLSEEEIRLSKVDALKEEGIIPYGYNYDKTHAISDVVTTYSGIQTGESSDEVVSIAEGS